RRHTRFSRDWSSDVCSSDLIMDSPHIGGAGNTFGGAPVACAAAIETIKIIRQPRFLADVARKGRIIRETLEDWSEKHDLIGNVQIGRAAWRERGYDTAGWRA